MRKHQIIRGLREVVYFARMVPVRAAYTGRGGLMWDLIHA